MKPSSSSSESGSSDSLSVHFAPMTLQASNEGAFERLMRHRITQPVVDHLVNCVSEAVDVGLMSSPPSPSSQPPSCLRRHPKFTAFVVNVLAGADVTMSVILTTLVYLTRSKPHLRIPVDEFALERVFLGALIIASKYLNDTSLKNADWAAYSGFFSRRDIGRIEREFLEVLDFELHVRDPEFSVELDALSAVFSSSHSPRRRPPVRQRPPSLTLPKLDASTTFSSEDEPSPATPPISLPHLTLGAPKRHRGGLHTLLKGFPFPHLSGLVP
ncbi:hypothetical protein BDZ89DRAFT_1059193 [Hymenopellis radicata]|nr:hypothetical protein BDZ89DRAFT_1059193 [Hymenopellis radicata]